MKQPKGEILSALVKTPYAPQPCHVSFKVDPKAKMWPLGLLQARYACIVIVEHQCIWTLKQRNRFSLSSSLVYCAACHVIFMSGCFVYHEQLLRSGRRYCLSAPLSWQYLSPTLQWQANMWAETDRSLLQLVFLLWLCVFVAGCSWKCCLWIIDRKAIDGPVSSNTQKCHWT